MDIHNYNDAIDCLNQIKPDCVMIGPHYEPIQYAFSIACKKLKIPLVSFYYTGYESEKFITTYDKIVSYSRIVISNTMPTDSLEQKSFLRRSKFILFKTKFLTKTRKSVGQKSNLIKEIFCYFKDLIIKKELPINELPDLHLLPDSSWLESLKKIGIKQENLSVTGSPFWDKLYKISKNYNPKTATNNISILIDSAF